MEDTVPTIRLRDYGDFGSVSSQYSNIARSFLSFKHVFKDVFRLCGQFKIIPGELLTGTGTVERSQSISAGSATACLSILSYAYASASARLHLLVVGFHLKNLTNKQ